MSQLRVNSIQASNPIGPVVLGYGATVPSSYAITGSGGINVVGVLTATTFIGNGNSITGINAVTTSRAIALTIIS